MAWHATNEIKPNKKYLHFLECICAPLWTNLLGACATMCLRASSKKFIENIPYSPTRTLCLLIVIPPTIRTMQNGSIYRRLFQCSHVNRGKVQSRDTKTDFYFILYQSHAHVSSIPFQIIFICPIQLKVIKNN